MKRMGILAIALALVVASNVAAKKQTRSKMIRYSPPIHEPLPADLAQYGRSLRAAAATDTFELGWWDFEGPDPQGWTTLDATKSDAGVTFHVADGTELDGGDYGDLLPLEGAQSMWCGVADPVGDPFCRYYALPGYGNNWDQRLLSDELPCDSVEISYKVYWFSEPAYDFTVLEYDDGGWNALPVNGGWGLYDGDNSLIESFAFGVNGGTTQLRFRFTSDGAWSDEDGLFTTDGAVLLDSITVRCFNDGVLTDTYFEDFEGASPGDQTVGIWTATANGGFGDFAALYPGITVLQHKDKCRFNSSILWAFFDNTLGTTYSCNDQVFPDQGALPNGPNEDGLYLSNLVVSPKIPWTGTGSRAFLTYDAYFDMPLDALTFAVWYVRSWVGDCPTEWRDNGFSIAYYPTGWNRHSQSMGQLIEPDATEIQVALGVIDLCGAWCGIYGSGACDTHAPLYDNVRVQRVNVVGPEFYVRHIDLFQDTFAGDGTLSGTARADMAQDIAPGSSPTIQPGDSIVVQAKGVEAPLGTDSYTGQGPAVYCYVSVWPPNQAGKTWADLEAPEMRAGVGKRFPLISTTVQDGVEWACFRMDTVFSSGGIILFDRYCFDLNDTVFTPGDTICYVLAAADNLGNTNYWSRRLDGQGENFVTGDLAEALGSPLEFTILPAGGHLRGGNILYVDATDDRGGPSQLFFDTAFDLTTQANRVDRYDVLGPSSAVGNGLASRVANIQNQIVNTYMTIIWCSGTISYGAIGDGTGNPEKSDDFSLLFQFLDTGTNNPGLYISGDDVAQEWVTLAGGGAVNLRAIYMNFNLVNGDHVTAGETLSPLMTATGPCFIHLGVPDQLIALGGCPLINDFDVLQPTGLASTEFPYPNGSGAAVISQATPNSAGTTARVILSGFSFDAIRDIEPGYPPARVDHLSDILSWTVNSTFINTGVPGFAHREFLANASPNPFNPETVIRYGIREHGHVSLRVYNVAGQLVRTLVNEVKSPREGGFAVTWDGMSDRGEAVATGVYFYKLVAGNFTETRKMVLLK